MNLVKDSKKVEVQYLAVNREGNKVKTYDLCFINCSSEQSFQILSTVLISVMTKSTDKSAAIKKKCMEKSNSSTLVIGNFYTFLQNQFTRLLFDTRRRSGGIYEWETLH